MGDGRNESGLQLHLGSIHMSSRISARAQFGDLDKPLYTISVAAEILETHPRTLMLYEDANLLEPHRTSTNRRRYSQRDIVKVQVIQNLTREKGVTLAGVRHILSLFEVMKRHKVEPPADLRDVFDRYSQII
jgi:MerR family transcriptional regulator/heat shock protein HspR